MIAQWFLWLKLRYIFIVKYSVLFGLFNWPWIRPVKLGFGLDLGLKCLASFNISDQN